MVANNKQGEGKKIQIYKLIISHPSQWKQTLCLNRNANLDKNIRLILSCHLIHVEVFFFFFFEVMMCLYYIKLFLTLVGFFYLFGHLAWMENGGCGCFPPRPTKTYLPKLIWKWKVMWDWKNIITPITAFFQAIMQKTPRV